MKNVVVLKMENVMVKDFNVQECYAKLEKKGRQALGKRLGADVLEKSRKVWEEEDWQKKIMKGVDEKRAEFYKSEFGKKLKDGWNEVFGVLRMLEEKKGVAVFVVSKHVKFKEVLRRLGCGEMVMVDFRGDWLGEILRVTGRERKDVVLLSNEKEDWERREEWGIKVEGFSVEKEGRTGFLGKLGLLVKDNENKTVN